MNPSSVPLFSSKRWSCVLWHKMEMFGPPKRGNGTLGQRDEGHPGFFRLLIWWEGFSCFLP